ncbi:MAG TPA: YraN family protein [Thermoanaerobaculia bacterium]
MNSSEAEDWKKRLKALGIVRKRRPQRTQEEKERERDLRKVESGRSGEALASLLLEENSLQILDRNVRYPDGEIDIIALDGATLVFVEVKRRRNDARGAPAEAVTPKKRERVIRAARRWLAENRGRAAAVRFDVVAIQDEPPKVDWIRGAFDASRT